jgi:hypothetical protein
MTDPLCLQGPRRDSLSVILLKRPIKRFGRILKHYNRGLQEFESNWPESLPAVEHVAPDGVKRFKDCFRSSSASKKIRVLFGSSRSRHRVEFECEPPLAKKRRDSTQAARVSSSPCHASIGNFAPQY